jgi:hypothetical protein
MTTEFLPRATVQAKLAKRGAKITTVVFAKKNGDVVRRTGMPKVFTRRVGGDTGPKATPESIQRAATAAKSLGKHGNVFFDNTQPGERGFAFNLDRVVHI